MNTTTPRKKSIHTSGPTVLGVDKVKRYKWNPLGKQGEFMYCDKEELHVDHGYQRDKVHEERITQMAHNWDWVACGAISVAVRGNKWFVIDGQHRKLAADKRSDITELPCMVFDLDDRRMEAQAFVDLNSRKTNVEGVDRFKAMIVAGDETAIGLKQIIDESGRIVAPIPGPKTVACIILVWRLYRRDPDLFRVVWPLVTTLSQGQPIPNNLVRGMFWAQQKCLEQKKNLMTEPYRSSLVTAGGQAITAEIRREIAIIGTGGERVEGSAIIKWLNRQKLGHGNKIEL